MDRSVPAGAALLLGFIYKTETSRNPPECYEVIYGHNQDELPKPLTTMTLDEVEAAQPYWSKRFGSSASGAAQFMRNTLDAPQTLRDIEGEMGLTGKELFSPSLQDRMAYHLLKRRGYAQFMAGKLSIEGFGKNLAKEWASFPVLADTTGAHRKIKRGQSYYAGDGLNKALIKPEEVENLLKLVRTVSPEPKPTSPPVAPKPSGWAAFIAWLRAIFRKD
jgi:muramidase (phage lysozyme)